MVPYTKIRTDSGLIFAVIVRPELLNISFIRVIDIGLGIGHEKDLIIGYRLKMLISCIPTLKQLL